MSDADFINPEVEIRHAAEIPKKPSKSALYSTISTEGMILSDLRIEGLEKEKTAYLNSIKEAQIYFNEESEKISLTDEQKLSGLAAQYNSMVEEATKPYVESVESALNQPIEVVLQNANVTHINDMVVAYRDAGAQATARMKEGATGKTLTEKPKSSKHGIALSGYIPIEQSFGKAGDSGQAERFNNIVEERFKKGEKYAEQLDEIVRDLNNGTIKEIPAEL